MPQLQYFSFYHILGKMIMLTHIVMLFLYYLKLILYMNCQLSYMIIHFLVQERTSLVMHALDSLF